MRILSTGAISMALLAIIVSCGGDSEPETADSLSTEAEVDTSIAEEPLNTTEAENPQVITETVPVTGDPEGLWDTTMGHMQFTVDDSGNVTGEYPLGTIEGNLTGNILEFNYYEGTLTGEGTFTFEDGFNSFSGVQDISGTELIWNGFRLQIL
ncbi:MAG: hypothetical protein K8S24_10170 [Candidatus Aegiribacteria sp.]|nr:hypothetical protein [Candidatus Aegiribacteria sp.]